MYKGERFNSYSHLIGTVFAIMGFILLMESTIGQHDVWKVVSFSIYGSTLILVYGISTIYHSHRGPYKTLLRKLDYLSIYIFIAGSYMPFSLVTLRDHGGWWIFSVIWSLAVIGILLEYVPQRGKRYTSIPIYLGMGWLILWMVRPLIENLGAEGTCYLALGGFLYSAGILFYIFDTKFQHFHGIWHLFVLAGSICHYLVVLIFVA